MSREKVTNCFFPKKSHHGYFDPQFQRHFSDKKQKIEFMNKHKWAEGDSVSKTHTKRVKDFHDWVTNEKRKNPNFEPRGERYPD